VCEGGDHGLGPVGDEQAAREVHEGLVFEIADHELNDGVLAMLAFHLSDRIGAVGRERVVKPVGNSALCGFGSALTRRMNVRRVPYLAPRSPASPRAGYVQPGRACTTSSVAGAADNGPPAPKPLTEQSISMD
jgi:hypothetical protein